ncbi:MULTISPECIES: SEC-C metal-binding domain-containing protein [Blautia]|nr:SEC-C domain-containing protein [Blautia obeum]MCB6740893.1 SEC-C domain-containing protein [Blautia sp. 210820-DFI.6.14]MCB6956368.1 SEC-C domain-containing protein [Blautia obeum]
MNPLAYFKIFNNEDCPCGSGKKFKECCKGKPD